MLVTAKVTRVVFTGVALGFRVFITGFDQVTRGRARRKISPRTRTIPGSDFRVSFWKVAVWVTAADCC